MITSLLMLFFVCFGLSFVIGKLPGGKLFLKKAKNAALRPIRAGWKAVKAELKTIARQFWCAHRTRIWFFFLGAGLGAIATDSIGFWWVLAISLVALGGLLAALAFATWRDALDDFIDWLRSNSLWLWGRYGTQIRWSLAGAITIVILKLGP